MTHAERLAHIILLAYIGGTVTVWAVATHTPAHAQDDDDDASWTPDPDRDQDCLRAISDLANHGPWDNADSYADGGEFTAVSATYGGTTYTATLTLPSNEATERCLLSWTEGSTARELWPEYDEPTGAYSVMNMGGWKAKLFDEGTGSTPEVWLGDGS